MDQVIFNDFRDSNIFHHIFGLKSQIITLSKFFWKSDFLGHCLFTQLFFMMLTILEENQKYLWCLYEDCGVHHMLA